MKMNSKPHLYRDKELNDLKTYLKKIDITTEKISEIKEFDIKVLSSQISEKYEKTISPGQVEAVLHRVMGITLTAKQRTQLYDLRRKIKRYDKFLTSFKEWGIKYDHQLKILMLGLSEEQSDYLLTFLNKPELTPGKEIIGVNLLTKLTENYDKTLTRLQIWDVSREKRFAFLRPQFFRGAAAAFLVFNKENPESFEEIKQYVKELKEVTGIKFKIKRKINKEIKMPIAVIATGIKPVVPYEEILTLTKDLGAGYFELESLEDERFQEWLDGTAMTVLVRLHD
jgi:GTPase SAR1 family protein